MPIPTDDFTATAVEYRIQVGNGFNGFTLTLKGDLNYTAFNDEIDATLQNAVYTMAAEFDANNPTLDVSIERVYSGTKFDNLPYPAP